MMPHIANPNKPFHVLRFW